MGTHYRANPISDFIEVAYTVTLAHGPLYTDEPDVPQPLDRPLGANGRENVATGWLRQNAGATIGDVVRGTSSGGDYDPEYVSVIVGTVDSERVNDVLQVAHDVAEALGEECLYVNVGGDAYLVGPGA